MRGQLARPVREGGVEKRAGSNPSTALRADPTTTSPWSTSGATWSPSNGSATTSPGWRPFSNFSPRPGTNPGIRSLSQSRPPAVCWWPACEPPAAPSMPSTPWRSLVIVSDVRPRGPSQTTRTRSPWRTSCAQTRTITVRCPPTPNSSRQSPSWPGPSKTQSGVASSCPTNSVPCCASSSRPPWPPSRSRTWAWPTRKPALSSPQLPLLPRLPR